MAEQRVNAAGQTVEFNKDSQRWEPVNEDVQVEETQDDTEEFAVEDDEGKPSTFNYTPRTDK